MRIAIGLTADNTFNTNHFGESRYFAVYELENGRLTPVEKRENPVPGHDIPGKGRRIQETIADCRAIIIRSIGKGALKRMPERGISIYLSRAKSLPEIEQALQEQGLAAFLKLNPATGKFESPQQG